MLASLQLFPHFEYSNFPSACRSASLSPSTFFHSSACISLSNPPHPHVDCSVFFPFNFPQKERASRVSSQIRRASSHARSTQSPSSFHVWFSTSIFSWHSFLSVQFGKSTSFIRFQSVSWFSCRNFFSFAKPFLCFELYSPSPICFPRAQLPSSITLL